ncbi:MAG: hypothetical protein WBN92_06300 [Terriglobia bacterium]
MAEQKSSSSVLAIVLLLVGLVVGFFVGKKFVTYPDLPRQVVIQANVNDRATPVAVPDRPYLSLEKNQRAEWFFTQDNWKVTFRDGHGLPPVKCEQKHCSWPPNGVKEDNVKPGTYEYDLVAPPSGQIQAAPAVLDPQLVVGN